MTSEVPDLGAPLAGAPGAAYQAFERAGVVIAVPDRLTLETDRHGTPQLLLALVRQPGGRFVGGRLELGLALEADLSGIAQALVTGSTRATIALADMRYAVVTVSTTLGALAAPQVLAGESLGLVRVVLMLDAAGATLAAQLVEDAAIPVNATMHATFVAAAPRMPLVLTYDPRAILERLAGRFGGERSLTVADLGLAMDELLGTADVVIDGDFRSVDPALRARALGLRLGRRLAARLPSNPAILQLLTPERVAPGRERLDLAAREMVEAEVVLTMDPLGAARAMRGGSLGDLVRRLEIEPVATGRRRVTISANLPERIAGLQALVADIRAPEQPPFRPLPESASVSLAEPSRSGEAELRLAPGERLSAQARLRAVVEVGGQATTLEGPWRDVQADHVLLGVQDFPVPLLVVRASRSLLAVAVVEIAGGAAVRLDPDRPAVALPLPNEAVPPQIVVRPLGLGREIRIDRGDARRIDLDPATLPGFGLHRARLIASATPPLVVEWRPDVDDQVSPAALRMGADRLSADISWVAASAFRPGLVWRTVRDGAPAPWCPPVMPAEDLVIRIDEGTVMDDPKAPIVVDGITLYRKAGDASTWTYVPRAPTLEADATGKPLLRIVEAGGVGFLQCTARVALRDADRAALLQKLRRLRPEAQAIEAAALTVQRVALEWFVDGAWSTASESTGSGMPPWTAALAGMLQGGALAALKAAIEGESGRAQLTAAISLAGTPGTVNRIHQAGSVRVTTPAGTTAASYTADTDASIAARAPVPLQLSADIADLLRQRPAQG